MAKSLDDVKSEVRERLNELRPLVEEYRELERAAQALGLTAGPGDQPSTGAPRRARTRRRARRGDNKQAVFGVIGERPGVTVGEIAQVTKIGKPLIYGVTRNGIARGELQAVDLGGGRKGFKLADTGDGAPADQAGSDGGKSLEDGTEGIEDPDTPAPVGG